jgi:hypothetical protein
MIYVKFPLYVPDFLKRVSTWQLKGCSPFNKFLDQPTIIIVSDSMDFKKERQTARFHTVHVSEITLNNEHACSDSKI